MCKSNIFLNTLFKNPTKILPSILALRYWLISARTPFLKYNLSEIDKSLNILTAFAKNLSRKMAAPIKINYPLKLFWTNRKAVK